MTNKWTEPPLPDLDALARDSAWVAALPGLDAELERLSRHATRAWPRVLDQAAALAKPRLGPATLLALLHTLLRFLAFTLFGAAGTAREWVARRLRRRGTRPAVQSSAAVRRAQKLVHAGGPAYVKVGQSIATAEGLLPEEWVRAFAWCRDEVPPVPPGVAAKAIEASLGKPISELFASFDPIPRAAASIAQVHDAVLHDGTEVVVKVQRPGLQARFGADLRVMSVLSAAICRFSPQARMSNPREVLPVAAQLVLHARRTRGAARTPDWQVPDRTGGDPVRRDDAAPQRLTLAHAEGLALAFAGVGGADGSGVVSCA